MVWASLCTLFIAFLFIYVSTELVPTWRRPGTMDSELAGLMPNINLQREPTDSSLNTAEIRKYMKVSRSDDLLPASALPCPLPDPLTDSWADPSSQVHPVLTERGNVPPPAPGSMRKHRLDDLDMRAGTGRVPQAKRFCIRIRRYASHPRPLAPIPPHSHPRKLPSHRFFPQLPPLSQARGRIPAPPVCVRPRP
jgi:hypothetical protein